MYVSEIYLKTYYTHCLLGTLRPYVKPSLFIPFAGFDVDKWIFKFTQGELVLWQPGVQGNIGALIITYIILGVLL